MPVLENHIATVLTFRPVEPGGKRVMLVPTRPVELTAAQLDKLYATDEIFRDYWAKRAFECDGWSPKDDAPRSRVTAPELVSPHRASPNLEVRDPSLRPQPGPPRSTAPIEPTPTAGVPGNSKQARASVYASMNPDMLEQWRESETRKTVLAAIDERLDVLATVPAEELEGATPPDGSYTNQG
jgi:hypothetical protein